MSDHDDMISMKHMLDYAREAYGMASGSRREDLDHDRKLQLALTRLIEIVGEAASRVSAATRDRYLNIPWRQIIGMRNRLIHGYDILDFNILWDTVTRELLPLINELEKAIDSKK
jgi:uncharacterized protein with HEPN domain